MNKKLTDDVRDINLGYVTLATWTHDQSIWPDWMREDDYYSSEINSNSDTDRVVWYGEELEVVIDYPISRSYTFKVRGPMTRQALVEVIQKHYKKIYASKESMERWGVWGHDIRDLVLHTLYVYKGGKAEVGVDS